MKAIICTKYGPPGEVLQYNEVEKPIPKDNEVLVKIHATTCNAADARIRGAVFPSIFNFLVRLAMGFKGPRKKILGLEFAGVIETVGKDVKTFKAGDEVFGSSGANMGAHAEYISIKEDKELTNKPSNMTFEEAAAVPHCALAALHYLYKGKVQKGTKILVYGASGGIGTFAVQLAKSFGAEVTGVCSTSNLEMVRSIGADKVIDYTREDLIQAGEAYDIIFDTIGKCPFPECMQLLVEKGLYLSAVHLELSRMLKGARINMTSNKKVLGGVAKYTKENLNFLKDQIESGKMKSVIDKSYSFDQMVEAHTYVDKGHKKGHVVVTMLAEDQ